MSDETKLSREKKFYADLAKMPPLLHGQGDTGDDEAVKAFDPEQSEVVKWLRANTDQATLVNIFLWTILKPLKVVRWDKTAKSWKMRTVDEYDIFKGDKKARREAKADKNAALNEQRAIAKAAVSKPPKPRGKPKKFPDNVLTEIIVSFHAAKGHWPTTGELWTAISTQDGTVVGPDLGILVDDEMKPLEMKQSLFFARLAWGKAKESGRDRIMVGDWSGGRNDSELKIDVSAKKEEIETPEPEPQKVRQTEPNQKPRPPKPQGEGWVFHEGFNDWVIDKGISSAPVPAGATLLPGRHRHD